MDTQQLDKLCGGAPQHALTCPVEGCTRTVGPYYSSATARDAMAEHISVCHNMTMVAGKGKRIYARTRGGFDDELGPQ